MADALPGNVARMLDAAAARYGMPAALARAVAWVESRGNPDAVSPAGAVGIMQLMPQTAEDLGVSDPFDAESNIDGGVRYLARLVQTYGERAGVASYNSGPGRGALPESNWSAGLHKYVADVLSRRKLELQITGYRTADIPLVHVSAVAAPRWLSSLQPSRWPLATAGVEVLSDDS